MFLYIVNKDSINLIKSAILRDILATGILYFFNLTNRHSNPQAISLNEVVKVTIKKSNTIKIDFIQVIIDKLMLKFIKNAIINDAKYIGHTKSKLDV